MAQQIKVIAAQAWQIEFDPWNPRQKERTNSTELASLTPTPLHTQGGMHVLTVVHVCTYTHN